MTKEQKNISKSNVQKQESCNAKQYSQTNEDKGTVFQSESAMDKLVEIHLNDCFFILHIHPRKYHVSGQRRILFNIHMTIQYCSYLSI